MEGLLLTLAMLGLMVLALVIVGRVWPRTSRFGGYRAGRGAGAGDDSTRAHDPDVEPGQPEDDDAHWRWPGDDVPGAGAAEGGPRS